VPDGTPPASRCGHSDATDSAVALQRPVAATDVSVDVPPATPVRQPAGVPPGRIRVQPLDCGGYPPAVDPATVPRALARRCIGSAMLPCRCRSGVPPGLRQAGSPSCAVTSTPACRTAGDGVEAGQPAWPSAARLTRGGGRARPPRLSRHARVTRLVLRARADGTQSFGRNDWHRPANQTFLDPVTTVRAHPPAPPAHERAARRPGRASRPVRARRERKGAVGPALSAQTPSPA
jgi:hypothetical protein